MDNALKTLETSTAEELQYEVDQYTDDISYFLSISNENTGFDVLDTMASFDASLWQDSSKYLLCEEDCFVYGTDGSVEPDTSKPSEDYSNDSILSQVALDESQAQCDVSAVHPSPVETFTFNDCLIEFPIDPKVGAPKKKRRNFSSTRRQEESQLRKVGACIRCRITKSLVRDHCLANTYHPPILSIAV